MMDGLNGQGHLKGYAQDNDRMSKSTSSSNSSSPSSMTHTSFEKSKMLDITRDKPIKVAVRVSVPVRDHPKFNFVGKLLGPKGNSLKRLQEETMCKMAVLGRGSMRDRKKEEELRLSGEYKYSHLSDDLHVEISTFAPPAEAHARIAYALAEVRRFLVPDHHDDIRQEQKWEMQALTQKSEGENSNESTDEILDGDTQNDVCSLEGGGSDDNQNSTSTTSISSNNNNIVANNNNCDIVKNNNTLNVDKVNVTPVSAGRKRPLLCTRNPTMNPTKRTVMTLLARAKTANALHGFHSNGPSITDLHLLTTPLIIPSSLEHVMPVTMAINPAAAQAIKKENLMQGA